MEEFNNSKENTQVNSPSFKTAFLFWLKLGFISFGGPAGQISIMHEFLVERMKWISPSRFFHALNYCMLLPGPEAQQLATYTGWLLHGKKGGLTAGILFIIPSIIILTFLSILYVSYGHLPEINAIFYGLKPAVVAIVILAALKIGSKALKSMQHYIAAASSFILIYFFNIPFPWIIAGAIIWGTLLYLKQKNKISEDVIQDKDELKYLINANTTQNIPVPGVKNWISYLISAILLWLLPYLLLSYYSESNLFWHDLSLFFTKAAFVTFGGAYAVLPYVAQVSVFKFHWLSELQMIDGLALGETTPGPLVMVLAFVGFMAGFNTSDGSVIIAIVALLVTTWYTFLPCFFFILAGAPIIEKTRENKRLTILLGIITAAVTGVILNLALYFSKAVIFSPHGALDLFSLVWIAVSFVVLKFTKMNMITWIGLSALAGYFAFQIG